MISPIGPDRDRNDVFILSSHSKPSLSGPINHAAYAQRHRYDYLFDSTQYDLSSPYDQKLFSIITNMPRVRSKWMMWIDEDAYFMDQKIRLESFLPLDPNIHFVFCRSPINPNGQWSAINAGVFFVRNSRAALDILIEVMRVENQAVKNWWDHSKYGIFIDSGDQERFVYVFARKGLIGKSVIIHDHKAFNSRVYHFNNRYDENFVCHLASHRDKKIPLRQMRDRFDLDEALMPRDR